MNPKRVFDPLLYPGCNLPTMRTTGFSSFYPKFPILTTGISIPVKLFPKEAMVTDLCRELISLHIFVYV